MHLFYHHNLTENLITFNPEESRHISVLRLKPGDTLHVTDGKGLLCKALVSDSNIKAWQVQIMERFPDYHPRSHYLHIAIAPTKQMERLEWFLEKATEIGIDEITPLICKHAERRDLKTERLHKIIQSAMKQSLKAWMPVLNEPVSFETFMNTQTIPNKFIANGKAGIENHLKNHLVKRNRNLVLIGPEGDFNEEEINQAMLQDYQMVHLGNSRLRTETAGVFITVLAELINS